MYIYRYISIRCVFRFMLQWHSVMTMIVCHSEDISPEASVRSSGSARLSVGLKISRLDATAARSNAHPKLSIRALPETLNHILLSP